MRPEYPGSRQSDGENLTRTRLVKGAYPGVDEKGEHTFLPCRDNLHSVDNLRVEPRGHLDANCSRKQQPVQPPQIRFLVPRHRIIHRHAMDDVLGPSSAGNHLGSIAPSQVRLPWKSLLVPRLAALLLLEQGGAGVEGQDLRGVLGTEHWHL